MDTRPTFSIITVTWRDLEGLRATAASVQAQTDRDFEWIVIDGASDDGTPEWLTELQEPTLNWVSEKDGGIYDAMNKGLDRARGRYALFLNAGDRFTSPEVLARAHLTVTTSSPDLLYGDSVDVQADSTRLYRQARHPDWLRNGMFTSHQAMFFSLDRAPGLRHDLRFRFSGDYAFTAEFLTSRGPYGPARCERIDIPICDFSLGGSHFTGRRRGMREDFLIRREILGESWIRATSLHLLHRVHHALKVAAPRLTAWLRYSRNSTSVPVPPR